MNLTLSDVFNVQRKQRVTEFDIYIEDIGSFADDSIGFNITLQRIVQPYLYQYYLPCIAIVIVSQISFIIPLSAVSGSCLLYTSPSPRDS